MKKKILIIPLIFIMILATIIRPKAAEIPGYPPNLANWSSVKLYSEYYHMRIQSVDIDKEREFLTIFIPDFDNIITSAGQDTEQRIVFYDIYEEELSTQSVFGRLTGWFNYSIPEDAYFFSYYVLVEGPLASNYITEWNDAAYVGYGDLLDIYQIAWNEGRNYGYNMGYGEGYALGIADSYNVGYDDGYDIGFNDGELSGYDNGYDVGFTDGELSTGFSFNAILGFVLLPFDLLSKEIAYGVTIGHIALIPIIFGLIGFLFSIKKGRK